MLHEPRKSWLKFRRIRSTFWIQVGRKCHPTTIAGLRLEWGHCVSLQLYCMYDVNLPGRPYFTYTHAPAARQ